MSKKTLTAIRYGIMAIVMALAILQTTVTAQDGEEQERSLEGVWRARITPRNCVTGIPNPTAAFEALFTFHKGGTISAWVQNSVITVTRSPSHGLWKRERGWSDYSFKFVHLRYNLTTGELSASQVSGGTLVLGENGDEFTTDASTTSFDVNGNPIGSGGCSNSVGTRFKLEQ
jgi:hypothetical protein